MHSWTTAFTLAFAFAVASIGRGDDPASTRTQWRIPDNRAVSEAIRWNKAEHSVNRVNLEGAIGRHHTYEVAWEYYAALLGCKSDYIPGSKRDTFRKATICEIPKSNAYKINMSQPVTAVDEAHPKDRRTLMMGNINGLNVQISLWTEVDNPDVAERVYVKMFFAPKK